MEFSFVLDSLLDGLSIIVLRFVDFVVSGNNIIDEFGFVSICFF